MIAAVLLVPFTAAASNANVTALGMAPYGHSAGTAASFLGAPQFGVGALVAPLVSLIGVDGTSMAVTTVITAAGALVVAFLMRVRLQDSIAAVLADVGDEVKADHPSRT